MFLLFLAVLVGLPVLEIYVIVLVGEQIGLLWTVVLLVASSMIGVRLVRSQGRAVLRNFQAAIRAGRPPAREALDGALVFVGGALLIAPGFITDVIGAILLVPPTRAVVRMLIVRHYSGRVVGYVTGAGPRPRRPVGPEDIDGTAVDVDAGELPPVTGLVRLGFGDDEFSAMAQVETGSLLCRGGETTTLAAATVDWDATDRQLRARVTGGFDVVLKPVGEPATFADGSREWLCLVSGEAGGTPIECLGAVLTGDGPPIDWRKTALVRGLAAWFETDPIDDADHARPLGFAVHAHRPARADAHEAESLEVVVLRGAPPAPVSIGDPRLSTSYDDGGHQRRAGLELWETDESDFALRLAGETIGEGELELPGGVVLRSAFLRWRHAGLVGNGRYDILLPPPG